MKKLVVPCPLIEYVFLLSKKIYDTFNENVLFIFPSTRKSELTKFAVAEPESFYSVRIWEKSEELPFICKRFKPLFAFSDIEGVCDESTRIFMKKKKKPSDKKGIIQYYIFGIDNNNGKGFKEYEIISYTSPGEEPVFSRVGLVVSQEGVIHEKIILDRVSSGNPRQTFNLREKLARENPLRSENTKAYLRIEFNGSVLRTLIQVMEYNPKSPYFNKLEKISKKFSNAVYQVLQ